MLRIVLGKDNVEVRFDHTLCDPHQVEGLTGISIEGQRRCSLATVSFNGDIVGHGMAICHPNDNFCKATGRKKALAYGLHSLSKELRTAVWIEYGAQCSF